MDKAFESTLDPEMMLDVRLVERRAAKQCLPEAKYGITEPRGSTYSYMEREEARLSKEGGCAGGKRSAIRPPRQMAAKRTAADVLRKRNQQWGLAGRSPNPSPSLAVSDRMRTDSSGAGTSGGGSSRAHARLNSNDDDY